MLARLTSNFGKARDNFTMNTAYLALPTSFPNFGLCTEVAGLRLTDSLTDFEYV